MTTMKHLRRATTSAVPVSALCLGLLLAFPACSPQGAPPAAEESAADPMAESAENVRLVAYHDLQGRQSCQVQTRRDAAGRNWLYVAHSPNTRTDPEEPILNPITGQQEWNGTSIVEITDPANPKLVWHIPNDVNANSHAVWVVYDYQFDSGSPGRDYLIRNFEAGDDLRFQIFDITSRGSDPSQISLVSEITGTPPDSCGPGCGGKLTGTAHKGVWSRESGLYYSASGEPEFRTALLHIWDLKDPKNPKFVNRVWLPGQKDGEPGFKTQRAHHPVLDEANNRLYIAFFSGGQWTAWDTSDPAAPKPVWVVDASPPGRAAHTISPIVYDEVPNFKGEALPRTYAFVTEEGLGPSMLCRGDVRAKAYMVDITDESNPFPVETWQVPNGDFCEKGGRFGPHQHAETVNSELNRFEDKLAWVAYFNAGVRVVDLSDPYNLNEVGHYLPKATEYSHPLAEGQPVSIMTNDVELDDQGLCYVSDRVGSGLFVLEYTGQR